MYKMRRKEYAKTERTVKTPVVCDWQNRARFLENLRKQKKLRTTRKAVHLT